MLIARKNLFISTKAPNPILADVFYNNNAVKKPIVIYAHGFKGFKDWGNFDLIAAGFAKLDIAFVKFNFSHNGMSAAQADDFDDLSAFSENNASLELSDMQHVIDWVKSGGASLPWDQIDQDHIILMGHSRGGGAAILTASKNKEVKKVITWASISNYNHIWKNFTAAQMEHWQKTGTTYTLNGRTGQQMPLKYQLYEDYVSNQHRLDIVDAVSKLDIPLLICHGTADEAVPVSEAKLLHASNQSSTLHLVEGANHVFGRKHPWHSQELPAHTSNILNRSIAFIKQAD